MAAGKMRNPAGDMCSKGQMMAAFDAPGGAGKDVAAAGAVSSVGGMKSEPGTPRKDAAGPGPANG